MLFSHTILPTLAFYGLVDAQGIQFSKVLKKKPELSKTTNTPHAATNTKLVAASITSKMRSSKPKPTAKPGPKNGPVAAFAAVNPAATSCPAQEILYGYVPNPNTPTGFLVDSKLANISRAATPYPAGYSTKFTTQYGSLFASNYITYQQLPNYNVTQCAALCDATSGCQAFNIYFERDPVVDPGVGCLNPNSSTMVRCALWGSSVNTSQAANIGEWRQNFMVVIQGSNGYNKNPSPAAVSGFNAPVALGGAVDVSSLPTGQSPFAGAQFYTQTFSPQLCADFCTSTTANNKAVARAAGLTSYTPCNFFNALSLSLNGGAVGTYCQAYSSDVSQYAGLYSATLSGVSYDLLQSYGYVINQIDNGTLPSAVAAITSSIGNVLPTTSIKTAVSTTATASASRSTTTLTSVATTAVATPQNPLAAVTSKVIAGLGGI